MAEQKLDGLEFEGGEQVRDLFKEIAASAAELAESVEKAGAFNDTYLNSLGAVADKQTTIATTMDQYSMVMNTMMGSLTNMNQVEDERLAKMRLMTDEKKKQLDTDKASLSVADQRLAKMQEMLQERNAPVASPSSPASQGDTMPAGNKTDPNGMASTFQRMKSGDAKATKKLAGELGRAVTNPMGAITSQISKLSGPAGVAAMVGLSVGKEVAGVVTKMQQVARTGGMSMSEGIGVGNSAAIEQEKRFSSWAIPFIKETYASDEQMDQGLGTMFGQGGIRGDELAEVFEDLPKKAYEAGMQFSDVATIMAMSKRVLGQSSGEMKDSFDLLVKSATEGGHAVGDYVKTISKATFSLAGYGATTEKMNAMVKDNYHLVQEQVLSEQELIAAISMGVKARMDEVTISKLLVDASHDAVSSITDVAKQLKIQEQIRAALIDVSANTEATQPVAEMAAKRYASAITDGTMKIEMLTGSMGELKSTFGMSNEQVVNFGAGINTFAKDIGIAPEIVKSGIMEMAENLVKITHNPLESMATSKAVYRTFAEDILDMSITTGDLNNMMTTQIEKFQMSTGAITANTKYFRDLGKIAGVSTAQIKTWTMGFAENSREMFNTPKEAMTNANRMIGEFAPMMAKGKMTSEDYNKVMRTQMDVLQKSPKEAFDSFKGLANIVNTTGTRMSELASWTENLTKINKQYGYDLKSGTALLTLFTDQLRSGAMSVQDLEAVLKGTSGGSDGYKALTADAFMSMNMNGNQSGVGQALSKGGMLGNVDVLLPELQRWASSKTEDVTDSKGNAVMTDSMRKAIESSPILAKALEDGGAGGLQSALLKEFKQADKQTFSTMMGGDTDATNENIAKWGRLSKDMTGSDLSSTFGFAKEDLYKLDRGDGDMTIRGNLAERMGAKKGDTISVGSMEELEQMLKDLPKETSKKEAAYNTFGMGAKSFRKYAELLLDNARTVSKLERKDEQKNDARDKLQEMMSNTSMMELTPMNTPKMNLDLQKNLKDAFKDTKLFGNMTDKSQNTMAAHYSKKMVSGTFDEDDYEKLSKKLGVDAEAMYNTVKDKEKQRVIDKDTEAYTMNLNLLGVEDLAFREEIKVLFKTWMEKIRKKDKMKVATPK